CHDDDRQIVVDLVKTRAQLQAIHPWHVQVRENDVGQRTPGFDERRFAIGGGRSRKTIRAQQLLERPECILVVVDQEDARTRRGLSSIARWVHARGATSISVAARGDHGCLLSSLSTNATARQRSKGCCTTSALTNPRTRAQQCVPLCSATRAAAVSRLRQPSRASSSTSCPWTASAAPPGTRQRSSSSASVRTTAICCLVARTRSSSRAGARRWLGGSATRAAAAVLSL